MLRVNLQLFLKCSVGLLNFSQWNIFVKFVDFDDDSDVEVDSNADAANSQEGTAPTKLPSIHHWYKQTHNYLTIHVGNIKCCNMNNYNKS